MLTEAAQEPSLIQARSGSFHLVLVPGSRWPWTSSKARTISPQAGNRSLGFLERALPMTDCSPEESDRQVGAAMKMLIGELENGLSTEWSSSGQHLLVDDGQTILVRIETDLAGERLWRGIGRTQPPCARPGVMANLANQPEVAHFEAITHEEQIAGLDIQMLKSKPAGDEVEGFGRVEQITQQLLARNPDSCPRLGTLQTDPEVCCPPAHSP